MEINGINIQIAQSGESLSLAAKGDTTGAQKSRRTALPTSTDAGSSQSGSSPAAHVYTSLIDSNYIREQIHSLMFDFPPFFPAGSPQRLDLIKGIKAVQEEIKHSKLPAEVKEKLAGQKLEADSTDKEISTALKGIKQYTEEHLPAPSEKAGNSQTDKAVSINI